MDGGHGLLSNSWPVEPPSSHKHCKIPDFGFHSTDTHKNKKKSCKTFQAGVIFDQKELINAIQMKMNYSLVHTDNIAHKKSH